MKYIELFSIKVDHNFYNIDEDDSLVVLPRLQTKQAMANLKLISSVKPMQTVVLQEVLNDGRTPVSKIDEGICFEFELRIKNNVLPIITDFKPVNLKQILQGETYIQYSNSNLVGIQNELSKTIKWPYQTDCFTVNNPSAQEFFFISQDTIAGTTIADINILGIPGISNPVVYSKELKRIGINTSTVEKGQKFLVSYRRMKKMPGVFGIIKICKSGDFTDSPVYRISLISQEQIWKYYVILPLGETKVSVQDKYIKRPGGKITFNSTVLTTDSNLTQLELKLIGTFTNQSIVRIESERAIKYSGSPYKDLNLIYQPSTSSTPIDIKNLSNPLAINQGISVINLNTLNIE